MTPAEIRRLRLAAGLTQMELARRIGLSPARRNQTVSDWERGIHAVSPEHERRLLEICRRPT